MSQYFNTDAKKKIVEKHQKSENKPKIDTHGHNLRNFSRDEAIPMKWFVSHRPLSRKSESEGRAVKNKTKANKRNIDKLTNK